VLAEATGLARLFPSKCGGYRMRGFDHQTAREVDQPMATCWLMRREAWEAVGPFDEQFPIFFNDVDWCYRAKRAGWRIWFEPDAKVLHHHGASTRQVPKAMVWESHRSLLRYYRKHFRGRVFPPLYWLVAAAIYLGAVARAKGWHAGYRPDGYDR
jgi:GT2 family glycosyltransferase